MPPPGDMHRTPHARRRLCDTFCSVCAALQPVGLSRGPYPVPGSFPSETGHAQHCPQGAQAWTGSLVASLLSRTLPGTVPCQWLPRLLMLSQARAWPQWQLPSSGCCLLSSSVGWSPPTTPDDAPSLCWGGCGQEQCATYTVTRSKVPNVPSHLTPSVLGARALPTSRPSPG